MDYSDINIFKLMQTKMAYMAERQDILARNVANADTPGYKPRDLKKLDFNRLVNIEANRLRIRATSENHITDTGKEDTSFRDQEMRKTYETTPVENAVVIEEQMMKIAENQMEYQKVTNLYSKMAGLFKTAIGNK